MLDSNECPSTLRLSTGLADASIWFSFSVDTAFTEALILSVCSLVGGTLSLVDDTLSLVGGAVTSLLAAGGASSTGDSALDYLV